MLMPGYMLPPGYSSKMDELKNQYAYAHPPPGVRIDNPPGIGIGKPPGIKPHRVKSKSKSKSKSKEKEKEKERPSLKPKKSKSSSGPKPRPPSLKPKKSKSSSGPKPRPASKPKSKSKEKIMVDSAEFAEVKRLHARCEEESARHEERLTDLIDGSNKSATEMIQLQEQLTAFKKSLKTVNDILTKSIKAARSN